MAEKVGNHRRHNSWDGRPGSNNAIRVKSSESDGGKSTSGARMGAINNPKSSAWVSPEPVERSDSRPAFSLGSKEVFGSTISLDQDDDDIFDRP